MIEIKNLYKGFNIGTVNETSLFNDFSLKIEEGEFVSVVGSNGSGKTTLLNVICGSCDIESGIVMIGGENVTDMPEYKRARMIDRVFQNTSFGTVPNMTVFENMSMADNKGKSFGLSRMKNYERREYYYELLKSLGLGLEEKLETEIGFLSGGQRQAIALLMMTLTPIKVLILDEHTAALDPHTADVIMKLTDDLVKNKGVTALMVTHNLRYAVEYGSRLIMMDKGKCVMDVSGEKKEKLTVDDILGVFNKISIECGN